MTLTELDHLPRDLWLDCCGHLSLFTVRNRTYGSSPDEEFGDNKSIQIRLGKVLKKDLSFLYEYDMGSTTELSLKGVGDRLGTKPDSPGIELLARNVAPDISCTECGDAEAEYICSECQYEESGWLCDTCATGDYLISFLFHNRTRIYESHRMREIPVEETMIVYPLGVRL